MTKIKDLSTQSSKGLLNFNLKRKYRQIPSNSQKHVEYFKVDKSVHRDPIHSNRSSQFDGFGALEIYSHIPQDEDSSSSVECSLKLKSHQKSILSCSDSENNKSPTEDDSSNNLIHANTMEYHSSSSSGSHYICIDKSPILCSNKKNYKSLTRERRVEANARERSRVHTISAAFESLRHAVPGYCNSPKLSKLGILRIACCYIESLNQLLQTSDKIEPELNSNFIKCIQKLAQTIASESKLKNNASMSH